MKFTGFIGPAYTLKSVSVDAQRCINLYPEKIESGNGKEGSIAYLKSTPGLELLLTVGAGPIRLTHVDSIGRILVVSGNALFRVARRADWTVNFRIYDSTGSLTVTQSTGVNTSTNELTFVISDKFTTGQKVRVASDTTLPAGLIAATDYWVIKISATLIKLASTLSNANAGTAVALVSTGTGIMTVTSQVPLTGDITGLLFDGTFNFTNDTFQKTAHGWYDGMLVYPYTEGTPLAAGLTVGTRYYVIRVDANYFKLATSLANVVAGTAINLTDVTGAWAATKMRTFARFSADDPTTAFQSADVLLQTTTGTIRAASMSLLGTGSDSTTLLVDSTNDYAVYNLESSLGLAFVTYGSGLYPTTIKASHVTWIDGYFIINENGTNRFWVSALQSLTINGLSFASSEGSPDIVMGLIANQRYLWVFNEKTTEVYANTGNADFPFERVGGGFVEMGCLAKHSIAKIDNTVFWLGRSEDGSGAVYAAKGITPERISTHAIEYAISTYASPSSATSYTYHDQGHNFFVLNFTEATWVFDLSTGLWHQRAYTTGAGALERQRGEVHAFDSASGLHLIGDRTSGKLYFYNNNYFKDDTDLITRLRASPHISSGLKRVFCSSFQLDMEVGVGLVSGQGSDPTVMLDFSNDGGNTWSSEAYALADAGSGQIGDFKKRVIWRRLGSFRDRIFRIKITDPVKVTLIGAEINVTEGQS